jgi:hypothetical protein
VDQGRALIKAKEEEKARAAQEKEDTKLQKLLEKEEKARLKEENALRRTAEKVAHAFKLAKEKQDKAKAKEEVRLAKEANAQLVKESKKPKAPRKPPARKEIIVVDVVK